MTPDFRGIAEKIAWQALDSIMNAQLNYPEADRDFNIILEALRQVYEQRPKVEIEWPSYKVAGEFINSHLGSEDAFENPTHTVFMDWLKDNTKIKEVDT